MSKQSESPLTRSFFQDVLVDDKAFNQVPILQKALSETLNKFKDEHHSSLGTVVTALGFVTGELMLAVEQPENLKSTFIRILDAYVSGGPDGIRTGPTTQKSFIRKFVGWPFV
jgi:hypothetical protein